MGSGKCIGGYFGWEFPSARQYPTRNSILLNSGHSALQFLLQLAGSVSAVWIPYFTCDIVPLSIKQLGIKCKFYHINYKFEISGLPKLNDSEYIIYTNYFGIMDGYAKELSYIYGSNLIIDNAQAFFAEPIYGCHHIYSPRKFFGVPDGGILVTYIKSHDNELKTANADNLCSHLLQRAEDAVSDGYQSFKKDEEYLGNSGIKLMSRISRKILSTIDFNEIRDKRINNFGYIDNILRESNGLPFELDACLPFACPMVYPYYTEDTTLRQRLIDNNIFVARYWPAVLKDCRETDPEFSLTSNIIPIPIDQRYDFDDMDRIISFISK